MRFLPTDEQLALAEAIDDIVQSSGGTTIVRAWGSGDPAPGRALWSQLADLGLMGLCVDESDGGVGGTAVDMVMAFERLGYHAVPGPYIESVALLPDLVQPGQRETILEGSTIATASVTDLVPLALDAASSDLCFVVDPDQISAGRVEGDELQSLDRSRKLSHLVATGSPVPLERLTVARAMDRATLASAAMLLGAGERMLEEAVGYAKVREQFGRAIGEYQALKHALADVRIALSFARPLVHAAALDLGDEIGARSVSAAKVATGDAATLAVRASLQVLGAVGYTEEHDLSLWITRTRALVAAWGSPAVHRARIARLLLDPES
mgnify:CR=1 FL=1